MSPSLIEIHQKIDELIVSVDNLRKEFKEFISTKDKVDCNFISIFQLLILLIHFLANHVSSDPIWFERDEIFPRGRKYFFFYFLKLFRLFCYSQFLFQSSEVPEEASFNPANAIGDDIDNQRDHDQSGLMVNYPYNFINS